jgi:hypothetical protein
MVMHRVLVQEHLARAILSDHAGMGDCVFEQSTIFSAECRHFSSY